MAYDPKRVIDIALAEEGYLEKATNANLDSKTANAGSKNYTKYARDLDAIGFYNGRKQSIAWCDVFVDWCFVQAFGKDVALAITFQPTKAANNCGAGCKYSRNYYKSKGRLYDAPEPGDQIFFYSTDKSSISHTGLVYKADKSYVYTVEGNTSGASGVVANGGGVKKKKYKLTYERLAGYGRPNYGMAYQQQEEPSPTAKPEKAYKLGERALKYTKPNTQGADVTELQTRLNDLGYDCGKVDGIFGRNTEKGLKAFQKVARIEVDGIFDSVSLAALNEYGAPVVEEPSTYEEYTVKRGDTLWKIAKSKLGKGNRYREIMTLNGMTSDLIRTGQVLKIPAK